jgi:hypothetical protein
VSLRRVFLSLLLSLCAWNASADDRQALLAEYGRALGVETMISSSMQATEQMAAASGERVLENFRQSGMSEDAIAQAGVLYQEVMKEVLRSWTAAEASRIYTEAVAASMSNDDLRAAIAFYTSTEGKRAQAATNTAAARLQAYIQDATTRSLQTAMARFSQELATVVAADAKKRQDAELAAKQKTSKK